jgi:hypothetical protein
MQQRPKRLELRLLKKSEKLAFQGFQSDKRVEGIEPSTKAWEAFVLPLNYTRKFKLV